MIFREKAATRIDDFDAKGYMLPPAVLKVLENAADHHSAAVADESLKSALEEYVQMRFYIKKPPTNAALKHYIARVFALYPDDADLRLQCVRQSVLNSRPNAFPLPSENSKPTASPSSARSSAERRARHAESMRDSWQIILSDIEEEREDG